MEKLYQGEFSPKGLSPLPLAFVGDGVYELLVREHLLAQGNCPVKKLNSRKVELVRCQFQAQALERLWAAAHRGGAGGGPAGPQRPRGPCA